MFRGRVDVAPNPAALVLRAAEWMTATASRSRAPFRIALSGGSTPRPLYELLASAEFIHRFPWDNVLWFWGDERFVPHDDPESNFRMAREAMLSRAPIPPQNVFPIPTDGAPDDAANRYERVLKDLYGQTALDRGSPLFDITLLGLGEDGHTASLIPGEPVLNERTRWVAAVAHGRPEARITLTYPAIESSRTIAFLVAGESKTAILRAVRSGNSDVPAARVNPVGDIIWFVDRAAAGG
jgi:6-phosphogluconolactonase